MAWYNDVWDAGVEIFDTASDFVSDNSDLLSLGVTGASAYYAYEQQADAIAAQEAASARALALQQQQLDMEANAFRLQAPNEQASIDLISSTNRISGSVNDFLYETNKAETTSVGLGIPDYEKSLGLA